jgi:ABC-type antimicrobial peptide transport system permease subunit
VVAHVLMPQRLGTLLLGLFGGLAILIASVGIFGAVAYGVSQRVREFGIRLALGASSTAVLRLALTRSLAHAAGGIALGLVMAVTCAKLARGFLYGVPPVDGLTYGATSLLLLVAAAIAAYLPARGATRIDPALTLRQE